MLAVLALKNLCDGSSGPTDKNQYPDGAHFILKKFSTTNDY